MPDGAYVRPLASLVADMAASRPDAPALIIGASDRVVTYSQLEDQVSAWVRALGARDVAGKPVGLSATASAGVAIGFLAILRSGGIVTPMDPALPADRLASMAEGVGCGLVLTDATGAEAWADAGAGLQMLRLDRPAPVAAKLDEIRIDPDQAACLYHTSGSTGRPKPVALSHRALSVRMGSMAAWLGIGDDEVMCAFSSVGFDPFLQQLFFALTMGNTLWLPERTTLLDPERFWLQAAERGLTHMNMVPSQIEALLARPPERPLPTVRRVVLGGERLRPDHARRIHAALGQTPLYNMYGPTEATVDATGYRVGESEEGDELPIGKPLPGCRIRVLDVSLARVGAGEEGELCIGGAGLALGYHGRDDATAERFVPDPFGAPGDRLYRTGDVAHWRADGRLMFGGRRDEQVKVRGQRIELGEVEAALGECEGVDAAAAVLWPDAPGGPALVAYVVGHAAPAALRATLARRLPAAAVPVQILPLASLPLMTSGKVDRKALPLPRPETDHASQPPRAPGHGGAAFKDAIAAVWAQLLGRPVDPDANLFEMGAHSLLVPRALVAIESATGRRVSAVDIFRFPTVTALARHLAGEAMDSVVHPAPAATVAGTEIAVVGMAFRFPGADDRDAFWTNLVDGVESVRRFDRAALLAGGAPTALTDHPDHVAVHAAIDGVDLFDPAPFGYGPGEAAEIDPQQRLLLQLAWHALEDAACDPRSDGPVGAFAGVGFNAYLLDNLRERTGFAGGADRYSTVVAADKDFAATRLAYKLDLTGPVMTVNTACSTAMSATAAAVDSLRLGRCRTALAGAVSLGMFSPWGYIHAAGGIASAAGRCRPFDAQADGTIGGAGGAVLVLKRLADALADGDTIHGVIRGVGVTNDGAAKAAFSAPSVDGQAAAIRAALTDAGVGPAAVGFVEGHGTATLLGDPIEVAALNAAYAGAEPGSILLGSVKGNVGHLDAAAGMAGLVKTLLALKHGVAPPTPHFTEANPRIPFAEGPFRVNASPEPWPATAGPRLAGVSGFGMGGANVHIIIEAPPEPQAPDAAGAPQLLTFSAATPQSLQRLAASLADRLDRPDAPPLAAAAGSLARRRPQKLRWSVAGSTAAEVAALLRAEPPSPAPAEPGAEVVLMFPGQGSGYPGMGRDLYRSVPAARAVLDEAAAILAGTSAEALPQLLMADPADAEAAAILAKTGMTQPALFVVEYATAQALADLGVRPAALIGHSVGEYVAACLAGVMRFEAALRLVAARGRLMGTAQPGAMLAVSLPEAALQPILADTGADLAAVNSPLQCVVSGTEAQIAAVADRVAALGKGTRRLTVSHAFHSALMEPILDAFAQEVARTPLAPPRIPIVSNLTGTWLTDAQATDPGYWVRHLRGAVRFADGVALLTAAPQRLLVECGPGVGLTRLARAGGAPAARVFSTLPEAAKAATLDGHATLLDAAGRLWRAGVAVARPVGVSRTPMPPYPFETRRLWIEPGGPAHTALAETRHAPALAGPLDIQQAIADIWRDILGLTAIGLEDDFLALGGDSLIAVRVAARLRERLGREVSADVIFRGGTVAGLARLLDETATRSALARAEDGPIAPPSGPAPLSSGQARMWYLSRLETGSGDYTEHLAYTLKGALDRPAVTAAIDAIVTRHAPLRSIFRDGPDGPEQAPAPAAPALQVVEVAPGADLADLLNQAAHRPFDLGAEAPVCFTLYALATDHHVLSVAAHHAAWDGWSNGVFAAELTAAYAASRSGAAATLPPLTVDIPTLARTDRARLESGAFAPALERLKQACEGFPTVLALPADRLRGPVADGKGASLPLRVEPAQAAALEQAGRQASATPYMVLLAAWAVLLARLTGERRLLIGAPVAGREGPEQEALIGYLSNTVVFPIDLDGVDSFGGAVSRVRDAVLVALGAQSAPFEALVEALAPPRSTATTPLVQSVFALQPSTVAAPALDGVEAVLWPEGNAAARYELLLNLAPTSDGGLEGTLIYATALFDESTAQGWLEGFQAILRSAAGDWSAPLARDPPVARPAPAPAMPAAAKSGADLRTPTEHRLAALWSEFLQAPAIDRDDDFFLLGGHSMMLMRLVNRIAEAGLGRLTLPQVLANTELAGMAALLDGGSDADSGAVPRLAPQADYALSPGQERLVVLQRMFPASGAYNVPIAFDIEGELDTAALDRAFLALETLHHALRLKIIDGANGALRQRLAEPGGLKPRHIALDAPDEIDAFMDAEGLRPFRLEAEAGARACVVRLAPGRWRVLLVVHHSLCDGWSVDILMRDLAALYAAENGQGPAPAEPERQFEDFATWQASFAEGPQGQAALARGVARLTPKPPPLDLPTDYRRPHIRSFRGGLLDHAFSQACSAGLDALIHDHHATPFAMAAALVQTLLYRLSGQSDLALGALAAPRDGLELRDTVGFLVNTLVLRQRLDGAQPFQEHLARTRALYLEALGDQHCPFGTLVDAIDLPRDLGRNPLFDVMVVWQDEAPTMPALAGLTVTEAPVAYPISKFDLAFHFSRTGGRIACKIEYSSDLFSEATAARLGRLLEYLAEQAVAEPARPLDGFDITPEVERALVTGAFNATAAPLDIERTIPAPFLDRLAIDPQAPALLHDGGPPLDYRQFAVGAGAVARRLQAAGVGAGDIVAFCLPRGPIMLQAIYGILLAGAAYAPLGVEQPAARVADMLEDLGHPLVLTTAATRPLVGEDARVLDLDEAAPDDAAPAPCPAAPGDLAYVLFTSGSTGRPKGVEIEHRSVLNRILWMQGQFPIGPGDVVLQKTPVTFDVSVWELFWWSWTGAAVATPPPGLERDPPGLAAFIARHGVTVMHFVPSMLAAFLACVEDGRIAAADLAGLRYVFASGEALDPALVERFDRLLHQVNGAELHNLYGPTEATVDVSWHPCSPWTAAEPTPIGRPIANTTLYVLDAQGRPQPIGVPGEIHIGGVQVARGYRNRPDLTRERFIPDPFAAGGRLYRTGDLGRWRDDGAIDYLGRLDHQVKVRGQRIEPGEIEHALEAHPAVERAVVVPVDNQGLTELHGYVLLSGPAEGRALIAHLSRSLPEAMVPARLFRLEQLPLTSSGKLDRKALTGAPLWPAAAKTPPALAAESPDAVEAQIKTCWRALLPGVDPSPHDGFFSVGGNSLLVLRLHQMLDTRWPGVFSVAALFAAATIAEQARRVIEATGAARESTASSVPTEPAASPDASRAIAVVGLAVRLPGGETLSDIWADISAGADLVRPLPPAREADVRALYAALGLPAPARFREAGYLDDVLGFDMRRFRMSPSDAALLDPEQRLFLDTALRALEDGGRGGHALDDASVGVFVGSSGQGPWREALLRGAAADKVEQAFALTVPSNIATRLSFLHNWRGPASLIDTACSSSLTAVHQACQALRAGECDWALAGGAKAILLPPGDDQRLTIDSSTGRTRAFDADADGAGMGEGAVVLLLRPLDAALAARDPIHAVILGSAVNQDGASSGMAAPNPSAQADVIRAAAADAGVSLASLSYMEAHGTGTTLGDPIEIEGLTRAFAPDTAETGFAWVGAGKGNYGHLDGAAGVLGLVRAILCLAHDQAPPQPFFDAPNTKIDFARAPVAVPSRLEKLRDRGAPRRAGVSAFGLSGVNAHALIEAPPSHAAAAATGQWIAIGLSAPDPGMLQAYAGTLVAALRERPDWSLEEIARSLVDGRDALPARLAMAVRDRGDLMARLSVYVAAPSALGTLAVTGVAPASTAPAATSAVASDEAAALAAAKLFVSGGVLTWPAEDRAAGRAHLPAAPMARRRLAPDFPAAVTVSSPAPASLLGKPVVTAEGVFHPLDIHAAGFWPVAEHRLDGEPTLVGMGFPALAAAALGPTRLTGLRWLRPLRAAALEPGTVSLKLAADGRVSLVGRSLEGHWLTFADAVASAIGAGEPPLDLAAIAARCDAAAPADQDYADGPVSVSDRWRCLTEATSEGGERLAWAMADRPAGLPLDPAMLDAFAGLALAEPGLIPAGCAELILLADTPAEPVAHIRTRPMDGGVEADIVLADAADGAVAAVLRGLRFVRRAAPAETEVTPSIPVWRPAANPASDSGARVLVIGEGPLADRVAAHLSAGGRLAGHLSSADIDKAAVAAAGPADIVLAPGAGPDLDDRATGAIRAVLASMTRPTRLLGLGEGAFAVDEASAVDPAHAVTWAVVHTAGLEEPMLTTRYVDTDAATPPEALLAEFSAKGPSVRAIAWRGGERLARTFAPLPAADAVPAPWPDHGVCVVTGGSGGLSLMLAESLSADGRVALALLSRRGALHGDDAETDVRRERLAELEAAGIRISHHACNVVDRASLAAALDEVRRTQGPITAVVHNAGVSDGGFLLNSADLFSREVAAKITGTRLLDELTRDDPLQAFVMAGSLSGLVGFAGFAGYMAGNAFEDGFAALRRRLGRPGLTIDWCSIGEMGMAARQPGLAGLPALNRQNIDGIWSRTLAAGQPQVVMLDAYAGSILVGDAAAVEPAAAPAAPRLGGVLETALAAIWAQVLGYDAVQPDDDFFELGGDSIAGMRIVEAIVRDLGQSMVLADLLDTGTVAGLAGRLRARMQAALPAAAAPTMAPDAATYPVSWEQLAVLNAEAVADQGTAYNLPNGLTLPDGVDPSRLQAAVERLVERREILRTRFLRPEADGAEPTMQVMPPSAPALDLLRADDESGALEAMIAWVRPFDVFGAPPVRFARVDIGGHPRKLLLDVHHALADAFSVEVLLAELGDILAGRDAIPSALQLKDYAWWSRRGAGAGDDDADAAYWQARFKTLPPPLDLPADRPRPAQSSRRADTVEFTLPPGALATMRAAAAARRATPFALVMAAWSLLLRRYARADDLVIATPVDSRSKEGLSGLVGMMVSLLPLRFTAPAHERVGDLIDRVQSTCTDALRHSAYGLGRLMADLAPPAQPERAPLMDVTLSYMNFAAAPSEALSIFGLPRTEGKGDLGIFVRDVPDGMTIACEYSVDLFDRERIGRMGRHFQTLLAALSQASPDTLTDALAMIDPAEDDAIAVMERGADPPLALDRSLFGCFVDRALAQPDAPALRGSQERLSYGDLLRRASGVAQALTAAGVRPGDRVALMVERDIGAVVLILGIVGAGAAYMPLDAAYPAERIAWLLEDSDCRLAIADEGGRAVLDGRLPVQDAASLLALQSDTPPTPPADVPAYLLYTSGSTGKPKGVLTPQRAVLRLALGDDYTQVAAADRVMQTGPLAFDASTYEIWGTLLNGAELCVATREELLDPEALAAAFERCGATVAWLTTGLFNRQADAAPHCFAGLRAVITGGDVFSLAHLQRALAAAPDTVFFNAYGPTENTTFSTMHQIGPSDLDGGPMPIGRPIAHSQVLVLEADGLRAPVGVWGEIAVGGPGLAECYFKRPDLTAERFRTAPAAGGERLYFTGDRGRWRADGALEFGGRFDSQIKLRGFRIELEEIEVALTAHDQIVQAAVLLRPGVQDAELVAYYRSAADIAIKTLRAWLAAQLPAYMIPQRFFRVDALPITTNGKLDRARLLAMSGAAQDTGEASEPPRPGTEQVIAGILAELFNRPVEDRAAGFLSLGGHSLLAIRVVNKIAEKTGVRLPMRVFFAADTVMALAAAVDGSRADETDIPKAPSAEDYPASHAQARLYLANRLDDQSGAYNIVFALPAATLDPDALAEALNRLAQDHEPLRTRLFEAAGQIRQQVLSQAAPAVLTDDLSDLADWSGEALRLARREAATPFDLSAPPLVRARALKLGGQGWLALIVLHHVAGDGWSTRILTRELARHYRDAVSGAPFAAQVRPIAYRDYAVWQAGQDWRTSADYWRRTLDGAPGAIVLPTDRPAPAVQSHRGDTVSRVLPPAVAAGLAAYARSAGVTMASVGLSLFSSLLYRLSRQSDLVVGLGVAGRDRAALESLIGFFVNVLPVRLHLDEDTEFAGLVAQAHAALLGAMEHRDYPFDLLVRAVAPKRSGNRQPLVNVVFEYQRFGDLGADFDASHAPAFGGGALDPDFMQAAEAAIRPPNAKHDLLLFLTERPGCSEFVMEFDTDVIDRDQAEQWLAYLEQFAAAVADASVKEAAE